MNRKLIAAVLLVPPARPLQCFLSAWDGQLTIGRSTRDAHLWLQTARKFRDGVLAIRVMIAFDLQ